MIVIILKKNILSFIEGYKKTVVRLCLLLFKKIKISSKSIFQFMHDACLLTNITEG